MIFKAYNTETVARVFFNGYFWGSLFLGLIALYGLASGAGMLSTLSGFVFIILASLLSLNKVFRRSPFSILFCFFTFLYLNIPAAFILVKGSDYIYGLGVAIPFAQSDYQQSLPMGFLYLSLFWVAMWLGIISIKTKRLNIKEKSFLSIKLKPILLISVIVLILSEIENQSFANVRLVGAEQVTSLLSFIFSDYSYLVMAGLVLFFKLNEPKGIVNSRKITMLIFIIYIGFTTIQFIDGSKAAILTTFMLLVLYPFCFFREYSCAQVSFPAPKYLLMLVLLSLPLFYFALIQRLSLGSGIAPDLSSLLAGISKVDTSVVYDIIEQIFYRFSHGGMDRYLLVFQSFIINTFDQDTSAAFVKYLAKNALNLLLPGTPFPESYAPSSQLFSQVIQYNIVDGDIVSGDIERTGLIISLNSQPYTIFGVFIIIFGLAAPFSLYLFTFVYIFIYSKLKSIFLKITMVFFFMGALGSYGIETTLGNSAHLLVSILLMLFLIKILSRFHAKSPVMSNCINLRATT